MINPRKMRFLSALIIVVLLAGMLAGLVGCGTLPPRAGQCEPVMFTDFRDIPGVTDEEIAAIDGLRGEYEQFNFGALFSTEAFSVV